VAISRKSTGRRNRGTEQNPLPLRCHWLPLELEGKEEVDVSDPGAVRTVHL
jgi:hypothetical protein